MNPALTYFLGNRKTISTPACSLDARFSTHSHVNSNVRIQTKSATSDHYSHPRIYSRHQSAYLHSKYKNSYKHKKHWQPIPPYELNYLSLFHGHRRIPAKYNNPDISAYSSPHPIRSQPYQTTFPDPEYTPYEQS